VRKESENGIIEAVKPSVRTAAAITLATIGAAAAPLRSEAAWSPPKVKESGNSQQIGNIREDPRIIELPHLLRIHGGRNGDMGDSTRMKKRAT